jgi:hypothetical protein
MSECRSGSPNDVRVPFRTSQAFARPQPAYRSASVPFRPAFRSGVPFSQRTVSPDPRTMSECVPETMSECCSGLPPGLHQAATRSSPSCSETMSECLSPRNDVRVLFRRRQSTISPVYNFCRAPSHRIELHAFLRSFCRAPSHRIELHAFRRSLMLRAIALSSMRSAVSQVPETMSECCSGRRQRRPNDVRVPFRIPERCRVLKSRTMSKRCRVLFKPSPAYSFASVQFRQRTVSPAYSFTSVPSGPKRCPSAVQAAASVKFRQCTISYLSANVGCLIERHPYLQTILVFRLTGSVISAGDRPDTTKVRGVRVSA